MSKVSKSNINWDDPESRFRLIEEVGAEKYNALFEEHRQQSTVATIGGWSIRPITSARFGRIFMIDGADKGFSLLEQAKEWCTKHPKEAA